jgi:DNA adenine methylase
MKTFIHWEGNKSKYIKYISPEFPANYNSYIEPFVGSGAMFLHIMPKKWIINDINVDLITIWNLVKDNPRSFMRHIKNFSNSFNPLSKEDRIVLCRSITNALNNPKPKHKAISIFLMKSVVFMGHLIVKDKYKFAGLSFKYNHMHAPFNETFFNLLNEISNYLNSTNGKIYQGHYADVLKLAKRNDFVFFDPPYIEDHGYYFNYNIAESLDAKFFKELLYEVKKLDKRGVFWLMTQSDTCDVREAFKNYTIIEYPVYRYKRKQYEKELIIKNY